LEDLRVMERNRRMSTATLLPRHHLAVAPGPFAGGRTESQAACREEGVTAAAILVATAFRLRDEEGLVVALRKLVAAVRAMELSLDG